MKKTSHSKTKRSSSNHHKSTSHATQPQTSINQPLTAIPLEQDVPEVFRASDADEMPPSYAPSANWSAPEDRGEDLAEERDPFMQPQERGADIPPELIQQRAYHLYEQRGSSANGNLADWFEAERQLRQEHGRT